MSMPTSSREVVFVHLCKPRAAQTGGHYSSHQEEEEVRSRLGFKMREPRLKEGK